MAHEPTRAIAIGVAAIAITLMICGVIPDQPRAQASTPAQIIQTATPQLPTPPAPAPALAIQEAAPAPIVSAPVSFDLAPVSAPENAAQEVAPIAPEDNSAYLANVGAQAEHSPRGDTDAPQSFATGPILYPDQNIVVVQPSAPDSGPAIAVAPISDQQAAIIGARQSATCPAGQTFYPRTGCHQEGSGGPQPGAVGEAQP